MRGSLRGVGWVVAGLVAWALSSAPAIAVAARTYKHCDDPFRFSDFSGDYGPSGQPQTTSELQAWLVDRGWSQTPTTTNLKERTKDDLLILAPPDRSYFIVLPHPFAGDSELSQTDKMEVDNLLWGVRRYMVTERARAQWEARIGPDTAYLKRRLERLGFNRRQVLKLAESGGKPVEGIVALTSNWSSSRFTFLARDLGKTLSPVEEKAFRDALLNGNTKFRATEAVAGFKRRPLVFPVDWQTPRPGGD